MFHETKKVIQVWNATRVIKVKNEFPFFGQLFLKSVRKLYIMLSFDFRRGFVEIEGYFYAEIILPTVLNQGLDRQNISGLRCLR